LTPEEYRLIELSMSPAEIIAAYAPRTLYELLVDATDNTELLSAFAAWAAWVPEDTRERDNQLFVACGEALRVHLARHGDTLSRRTRKRVAALVAIPELGTVRECGEFFRRLRRLYQYDSNRMPFGELLSRFEGEIVYTFTEDPVYSVTPLHLFSLANRLIEYDVRLHSLAFMSCLRVYNGDLRAKKLWEPSEPEGSAQAWYRLQRAMWPEPTPLDQSQTQGLSGSEA
jgi:hypothetical protein